MNISKKSVLSLLMVGFVVYSGLAITVNGQVSEAGSAGKMMVAPDFYPQPQQVSGILGQDHKYTVTFRGNGEAVVSARIAFSNASEATMSALTLRVPRVAPEDVFSYQIIRERVCMQYAPYPQVLPTIYPFDSNQPNIKQGPSEGVMLQETQRILPIKPTEPICIQYQEPNHFEYWYGNSSYQKAMVTETTDSLRIDLPSPVNPNTSGSILLYYRAPAYTKHALFGAYNFQFETLKVEDRIKTVQVGINTDSDLFLRDAQSTVNYQVSDATAPAMAMKAEGMTTPMQSAELDSFVQQIGYGSIVKSATDLQPLDSYTVKGTYASSRIGLYSREITIGIVIGIIILVIIFFIIRMIIRKMHEPAVDGSLPRVGSGYNLSTLGPIAGFSFVSSILTAGYSLLVMFLMSAMRIIVTYEFESIIMLGVMVISFAVYALFIFGPSLYLGIKKGFWHGAMTFILTIGWLVFYFVIMIAILFTFRFQRYPTYYEKGIPQPMMWQGAGATDVSVGSAPLR